MEWNAEWLLRAFLAIALIAAGASGDCPVEFGYVGDFSSTLDFCRGSGKQGSGDNCCSALLPTFGVGVAEYLQRSGGFEFPDLATATACLDSFQRELDAHGAATNFIRDCPFTPAQFVQSPICAGVTNISDWHRVVSPDLDGALRRSCGGDLASSLHCQSCTADLTTTVLELQTLSNSSVVGQQCVYVACLYAAGVINKLGPREPSTALCILGVSASKNRRSNASRDRRKRVYIGIGVGGAVAVLLVLAGLIACIFQRRTRKVREVSVALSKMPNLGLINFSYEELKAGTQNFSSKNFIGEGGYGRVYRGILSRRGNSEVAVKVMKAASQEYSNVGFLNEVEVINRVRHRNLVHVRGACVHGSQHILVYDYMPNGCLQHYLSFRSLSWPQRQKIAIGIAVGINYLHNEVEPAIIHRDIKPSNILLDEELNARVADFGLAKISSKGMSLLTTRVAGTPIYMAVEYALYGQCSDRVDVYSFGILLLELMSGRRALELSQDNPIHYHIVDWAWSLVKAGKLAEIIDERLRSGSDPTASFVQERFVLVGILCAHLLVAVRPSIAQALKMLEGDERIPPIPDRPPPYILRDTKFSATGMELSVEDGSV